VVADYVRAMDEMHWGAPIRDAESLPEGSLVSPLDLAASALPGDALVALERRLRGGVVSVYRVLGHADGALLLEGRDGPVAVPTAGSGRWLVPRESAL
jgi:hypothetical protein